MVERNNRLVIPVHQEFDTDQVELDVYVVVYELMMEDPEVESHHVRGNELETLVENGNLKVWEK